VDSWEYAARESGAFGLNFDFLGQHFEEMLIALGGLRFGGKFEN
jgi:hypothetical protein